MSEYWKSTPKYWCKNCKLFVRDTKLERQNHDATPRHQGNLNRYIRDLQRGQEKDEKDKERAKSEVARLNGLVSGTRHMESSSSSGFGRGPAPSIHRSQATPTQRKQQLVQLAEMGVNIPDELRGEMAMLGEWQVTSERIVEPSEAKDKKPEAMGFGVRKRPAGDDEEEFEAMESKRKMWGSAYRTHPGDDDSDLDALLRKSTAKVRPDPADPTVKQEPLEGAADEIKPVVKNEVFTARKHNVSIKREPSNGQPEFPEVVTTGGDLDIKRETDVAAGSIVFKKHKAKNIRQK